MADDTNNEINYIISNPLNLEQTLTIMAKQEEENNKPSHSALLDCSETRFSGGELGAMEENYEKEEGKEELQELPENHSEPGVMPMTNNTPRRITPSPSVKLEDQDCCFQIAEEWDQVDANFNNIAVSTLMGANDPHGQVKMEDQVDNAHVDWCVTVLFGAFEVLSELSHCQSDCQSCC